MTETSSRNPETEWRYARAALAWYGWGSPTGVGLGLVFLGAAALLIRLAIVGI